MTLFRLLLICLVLLVATLTATTLLLFVRGSQAYLVEQLASHGQDTATSFGLSLSPVLAQGDWVLAESMVDAIFDRGDYASLELIGRERKLVRHITAAPESAPRWFKQWIGLEVPMRETEINAGWQLVATLKIQVNQDPALLHLYRISLNALLVALVLAAVAILSGAWGLRWILAPLKSAQAQAEALRRRRFLKQDKLPWLLELRALTLTMNRMVENSELQYKQQCKRMRQLQQNRFIDTETGLGNGTRGRDRLDNLLRDRETEQGVAVQIHLMGLEGLERSLGVAAQQPLMTGITELLRQQLARFPLGRIYRMGQADFWALLPGIELQDWLPLALELEQALSLRVQQAGASRVVVASEPFLFGGEVAEVEQRLHAQIQRLLAGESGPAATVAPSDRQAQMARLEAMLARPPKLLAHRVIDRDANTLYFEVLTRFHDGKQWRSPGAVVALAQRLERQVEVDLLVLDTLLTELRRAPLAQTLALNLTTASLLSQRFISRLREGAREAAALGATIAVEIPEQAALEYRDGCRHFVELMQRQRVPVWLDHVTPAGLAELEHLPVVGIKLDPAYSRHMNQEGSYQSLLPLMVTAAHARSVLVVAEQVEQHSVAERLRDFLVDGLQGFAFSGPLPLSDLPRDGR
ncbi:EAL domain-containing protein [Ferrimonas sediminicola]|uniref:EAL domain-containing protein n=1 Tax=Ferrimonas sediminicola TaxID=2569538 RepID=A0A4U1BM06_9GAMM|nr:EAL domain-containing protein [Ferrimonas sediminicola]TKB51148.1 EAL domain-containing protein [Ferrimonas sediminicola]